MGKVKPTFIKRIAIQLIKEHSNLFNTEFDYNKKVVQDITDVKGIHIRNRIAGYVTRRKKSEMRKLT